MSHSASPMSLQVSTSVSLSNATPMVIFPAAWHHHALQYHTMLLGDRCAWEQLAHSLWTLHLLPLLQLTGVSGQPQQVYCNFLELETQSACVASLSRERPCGTHWHLRSASAGSLQLPRAWNTVGGLHSFSVTGTSLWNSLASQVGLSRFTATS